ncbi:DarT ssDNA thymidine ADP-ribosyltransferase family protein [Trichocoleus sp. FACHB-262]|uniref:DarT ssDNA thymidine ADP-ribosyltransferase family protein n=1 Tax=Trichocoleus sp. FACHB-262 TaxID=2692869 RepID=UPI001686932E|nr:DarT ssDNA thymidine ADP-ribosyltransferase family protein [Trichocoleus sp. FACHB-262]MBD2119353.1 DUF4433 domain-containing protein [Trichocoleus sp. FACHB-262]
MPIEKNRLLYHLTSLENIESILRNGLLSRRDNFHKFDDVAESDIIKFRKKVGLDLYVPFHFFPKNPFDGRVQIDSPKKTFIYICVSKEFARNKNFKVVTKHPTALKHLSLYRYLPGIKKIDWHTMNIRDYSDDNCRHVCMAECLSPNLIKLQDFECVYAPNNRAAHHVKEKCLDEFDRLLFPIEV